MSQMTYHFNPPNAPHMSRGSINNMRMCNTDRPDTSLHCPHKQLQPYKYVTFRNWVMILINRSDTWLKSYGYVPHSKMNNYITMLLSMLLHFSLPQQINYVIITYLSHTMFAGTALYRSMHNTSYRNMPSISNKIITIDQMSRQNRPAMQFIPNTTLNFLKP